MRRARQTARLAILCVAVTACPGERQESGADSAASVPDTSYVPPPPAMPAPLPTSTPSDTADASAPASGAEVLPTALPPVDSSAQIQLFFIVLEGGKDPKKRIGCGDAVAGVALSAPRTVAPLRLALEKLLSVRESRLPGSNLYNALDDMALRIDSIVVHEGTATIGLSGTFSYGGMCDAPRIEAQLTRTATQFPAVRRASFFINGRPLEDMLSEK